MSIFSNNIIGTGIAILVAGGLILAGGNAVNNHIDQVASSNQPALSSTAPTTAPTTKPTNTPAVQGIQTTTKTIVESDPIINCIYPHTGTLKVRKSECDGKKIDCEVEPGKWQVVWKEDCDALLAKKERKARNIAGATTAKQDESNKEGSNLIDCVFDDSWGKKHVYKQITQSKCDEHIRNWTNKIDTTYQHNRINCTVSTGTYFVDKKTCDEFKQGDEEMLKEAEERQDKLLQEAIERATDAYNDCVKGAESMYTSTINGYIAAEHYLGYETDETGVERIRNEAMSNYNRAKQQCEQLYPPL